MGSYCQKRICTLTVLTIVLAAWVVPSHAASFGKVIAIGGHASDIALDEPRGVLYLANLTANRIDVVSLGDGVLQTSFNVGGQPASVAVSPSGEFLLVGHYGNFTAPNTATNGLTLINLNTRARSTMALSSPVLGVAFGNDGQALVVTSTEFHRLDPAESTLQRIDTVANVTAKTLPVPTANQPPDITNASVVASADGSVIYGLAGSTGTFTFRYNVADRQVGPGGIVLASGVLGPRTVSINRDGSRVIAGWVMIDEFGTFINYFKAKTNQFSIGSSAIDSSRGIVYAQIPEKVGESPVLQILDSDNLAVIEKLKLPENLTGKSLLSADGSVMYSVSESGAIILPVGSLRQHARLVAGQEDVVFRANYCDKRTLTQEFDLLDPGGNRTAFSIKSTNAGVTVQPASGTTPARIRVTVDPQAFAGQKGTVAVPLTVDSASAVNVTAPVRVLVNLREPDQRGTFVNVPGTLTDIRVDNERNRFYVLRQDRNQVLVFDAATNTSIATLKTYNSPTSLAVTMDGRYLLVGHDGAQVAAVFDLDTLERQPYISTEAGAGNEARSIAVAADAILAAAVDYQGKGHVIRLDMNSRRSYQYPTLGVYANDISPNTVAAGSQSGSSVLFASAEGGLLLYSATAGTFTVSRKETTALTGAYAASNVDTFLVGNNYLNATLVPTARLDASTAVSSGFVFVENTGVRTLATAASDPGVVQRLDLTNGAAVLRSARTIEAPLAPTTQTAFTRTLGYVSSTKNLISLSISGFLVLPWPYDENTAPPLLSRIVSAADQSSSLAPGSLVTIWGENLSPVNEATRELPLPTALGESCLLVNGAPVPMLFVSPTQINAQLPYSIQGNATLVLRTPAGISDNLNVVLKTAAPAIFRMPVTGLGTNIAAIVRAKNGELVSLSNPIHRGDSVVIFLAGMGRTTPAIEAGIAAPSSPRPAATVQPVVTLGGTPIEVGFAGLAPGQVGIYQIEATVPGFAPLGVEVPLVVVQGGEQSAASVRVVDK
ncbi:MAG: hypothetical protein IT168_29605 [Bryobacterales bacterium]|nr:hypothetical protein [Bryobacterales bacterium]